MIHPLSGSMKHEPAFTWVALIAVLAIGLTVRVIGLGHGAPDKLYHPDVSKISHAASKVYHGHTASMQGPGGDHRFKAYPYGHAVTTGWVLRQVDRVTGQERPAFEADGARSRWYWSYILRWSSTMGWLIAVAALLLCVRRLLTPAAWLVTGLLWVLEPYNAQYSHYGMNDVSMTACLLMVWACIPGATRPGWRGLGWTVVAGLCLGAGFSIKYQAILGGIMLLPVWIQTIGARRWRPLLIGGAAFGAAALAAALATNPLMRTPGAFWSLFVPFMEWQSEIVQREGGIVTKLGYNILTSLRMMGGSGHLLLMLAAFPAGLAILWRRSEPPIRAWVAAALAFTGVMLVILLAFRAFPRSNDMLPLFPFLIGILGIAMDGRYLARRWSRLATITAAVLLCWFGATTLLDSGALSRPDTRERAWRWCLAHVQPGEKIYREHYTLALNKEGVNEQLAGFASRGIQKGRILENNFDYTELSSLAHARFSDRLSPYYSEKNAYYYKYLFTNYPVLAAFEDRRLFFAHPEITVIGPRKQADAIKP